MSVTGPLYLRIIRWPAVGVGLHLLSLVLAGTVAHASLAGMTEVPEHASEAADPNTRELAEIPAVEVITRAAVMKALQTLDGDFDHAGAAVAVAKARAGTTATLAVQEGVQMHGGMGMTDQFDIGFFMKRARACQELFGDSNFHADQLARMKSY